MLAQDMVQTLGAAAPGNDAEIDFRLAETSGFRRDNNIAAHRQFAAAAQGEAADRGDYGLGDLVDLIAVSEPLVNPLVERTAVGHFLDVGARGEDFFCAGGTDHSKLMVVL